MYYLYLKIHNDTGLKYLGQTSQDPYQYKGSGTRWAHHIKKHGYDVTTIVLYETDYKEDIEELGKYYSDLWNIVDSKEFANLKKEEGDGGPLTDEIKQKMSESHKGKNRKFTEEHKKNLKIRRNICLENNQGKHPWKNKKLKDVLEPEKYNNFVNNLREKCTKYGEENNFFGKTHSDETKQKVSDTKTNVYLLDNKIIVFGFIDKEKAKKLYNTTTEQILCKKREFINNNKWLIYN